MREHGRAKYVVEKCRCDVCRKACRDYERERQARQVPAYVGADRARQHLAYLQEHGVGYKTVAKRSGVSNSAIGKIIYGTPTRNMGPSKRIRPETEAAILAVSIHDAADGAYVSATDVPEIVATLTSRGWTKSAIARRVHGPEARALQLDGQQITAGNLRALRALLDEPAPEATTAWAHKYLKEAAEDDQDDDEVDRWANRAAADPYDLLRLPEDLDSSWKQQASCRRPEYPTYMFFPARGDVKMLAAARAVCARCPVHVECREYASVIGATGVWGGKSEKQRKRTERVA